MPKAGGLPDVTQRFDADNSGYIKASDEIVIAAIRMAKENRASIDDIISSHKEMMAVNVELRSNLNSLIAVSRDVINVQKEMAKALGDTADSHDTVRNIMRTHADQANQLIDVYKNMGDAAREVTAHQHDIAQSFLETMDPIDRLEARYGTHKDAITAWNKASDDQVDRLVKLRSEIVKTGEEVAKTSIFATPFTSSGGGTAAFTGDNSIAAYRASLNKLRTANIDAELGIMKEQMGMGGGRGGGGGMAGLFGTGAADTGGSFVPWRGGGWNAVRFWGMMTAEVAATVVPALTAAGSAALVGVQSIEAMVPRYKAIFTTSEALGDAFGMSTGKFLGGGTALQQAQDAYQGAGYVMAGNLLDILHSGGGQGFIDMGKTTLGMLTRGTSAFALNVSKGGLGKRISDVLGGGPEYLRSFGDIFSNLGNTLLNVAPNLPGVGADLLGVLKGGTGLAATLTRDIPGPMLGGLLAYEAGSRWIPALLGGRGLIGRMLGLGKVGGIGGLLSKGGIALGGMGAPGGMLESLGLGISGAGEALAGMGSPVAGVLGATAYLMAKGFTAKNLPQQRMEWLQQSVGQAGFTGAWQPLAHAVTVATQLSQVAGKYAGKPGDLGMPSYVGDPRAAQREAVLRGSYQQYYAQSAQTFAGQIGELTGAAPALVKALKSVGMKGVTFADALQIAQNAILDIPHAFSKGKLTPQAIQAVQAYARVIAPMTQSPGAFGAAVGAQTIMSQGAMQNLAKVNQAMDSYQQIIAAGPVGASALAAGAKAAPAGAIAKGLTGYLSPTAASAWQAYAAPQTGFIAQMQSFGDQMRTYLTLGTATLGQTKGFSATELQRILPQARQSPAALAMLMQQGAAMGVTGYYDQSKSQAQNYKDAAAAIHSMAYSSTQFKKNMDSVTIATANVPQVAAQFANATAATRQSQQIATVTQAAMKVAKGIDIKVNAATIVSQLKQAGVQGASALKASLNAVLSQAGVGKAQQIKIDAMVLGEGKVKTLQQMINSLHNKNVNVAVYANAHPVQTLQAALSGLTNKTVTVTTRMVTDYINIVHNQLGVPKSVAAGVAPGYLLSHGHYGGLVTMRGIGMQTGGMVPGSGLGDIIPAMLEPGEAIIPRYLVPLIAPILAAHRVPGFGGMPQSAASHFAAGGIVPGSHFTPHHTWPHFIPQITIPGTLGKQFTFKLIEELTKAIGSADAKKLATSLVNKITQEIAYAKNVSASMRSGLNLGGMDVTPGTGNGTVQEQMQSYLASMKSFSGDLNALRKGHLNKALIKQLVDAGPVQGDALAQSILQGPGGIKAVNKLWSQIGGMSNKIGAQAAMAQFGGTLAPNLRSGTFVGSGGVNISINVNAGQGGTLSLTDSQIKALVAKVQAALLKQAKRNNQTGIQLSGKGA